MSTATATQTRSSPTIVTSGVSIDVTHLPGIIDRMFLLGPPGIGKSEIVKELAKKEAEAMGREFVDVRELLESGDVSKLLDIVDNPGKYYLYLRIIAPHLSPEDVNIPVRIEDIVKTLNLPPQEASKLLKLGAVFDLPRALKLFTLVRCPPGVEPKSEEEIKEKCQCVAGTLFIDELTNVVSPRHFSMYYSIILEKEIGLGNKMSPLVKVVAAGNPPGWSSAASNIPLPLINRMVVFDVRPPTVDEWFEYMERKYGDEWDKSTYVYLKTIGEKIGDFIHPPSVASRGAGLVNFPTPRSWTTLARILYRIKSEMQGEPGSNEARHLSEVIKSVIYGCLGPETGKRFYIWVTEPPIPPEEVIKNPGIIGELGREIANRIASAGAAARDENALRALARYYNTLFYTGAYLATQPPDQATKFIDEVLNQIAISGARSPLVLEGLTALIAGLMSVYKSAPRNVLSLVKSIITKVKALERQLVASPEIRHSLGSIVRMLFSILGQSLSPIRR